MLTEKEKEKLKALALRQIGKPYIFGVEVKLSDTNPAAFDCSELVQWLYWQIGYVVPDGSFNQYDAAEEIQGRNYATGDLAFCSRGSLRVGHVGVVLCVKNKQGKNRFIVVEARNRKVGVVKTTLSEFMGRKSFVGVRRLVLKRRRKA